MNLPLRLLGTVFVALLAGNFARAHDPFEITTLARLHPDLIELHVTMARSTALAVATGNPEAPTFEPEDFEMHRGAFETCAPSLYTVKVDGVLLPMRSVGLALGQENDVDFKLVYPRPPAGTLRLIAGHIGRLPYGYGAMLTVQTPSGFVLGSKLLMANDGELEVLLPSEKNVLTAQNPPASTPPAATRTFRPFLQLGLWHIVTGYDHLLFLIGLLLACQRTRAMVGIVTSFTLAHSITLALAALDVVTMPSTVVEPLIAASIVYVGVENLFRRDEPKWRWLLAFGFGLIHGFGFSGALREAGLGADGRSVALPLFSFNLGVELGQLAIVCVALPLLAKFRERPLFESVVRPTVSALVAGAGAWWLLQRTVLS